ncbi:MAG TPA: AAA family ATPase [Solirubrobacteraceae bacterium]|nr:AAA family ATPase [Solirubrobacteraceae bacterium]
MTSLEALSGYLPPNVLRRLADGPAELPYAEEFVGAVIIADISGFTRITEQMDRRGPEGAETLAALLNVYFGRLIDHVHATGGDVFSFTGDGLIAACKCGEDELEGALHTAAHCASALAATESEHPEVGGVRLSVRLGVSAGPLRALEVGGLHGRRFSILGGEPLEAAAAASELVAPGQVGVDAGRWPLLAGRARGEPLRDGYVRIAEVDDAPTRSARPAPRPVPAALLTPYIPPPVVSREGIGQGDWLAELRRVTVVYVQLPGIDHRAEPQLVQQAVVALQREFDRHEATINNLTVDAKGTSIIAATGLPPLSHDDDPVRAVRAAMAVARTLGEGHWRAGVGVATGRAFCGAVGNLARREYAMSGDVVNTAARLTGHALRDESAPVAVLCDAPTERATRQRIDWGQERELVLKGKEGPVIAFTPVRQSAGSVADVRETVGRRREREALARAVQLAAKGTAQLVVLEGEPGMGKSRLLLEVVAEAGTRGVRCLGGHGDPIERAAPYHAWRSVYSTLLGAEEAAEPEARAAGVLAALPEELRPRAPLLNLIVGLELPDSEESERLQGERRIQATRGLLVDILADAAREPLVIAIDDGHWLDSASWALIEELSGAKLPICVILGTRPGAGLAPEYDELLAEPTTQLITLAPLDAGESVEIACDRLGVTEVPPLVVALVVEKAAGNPLFAEELAYALRDSGLVKIGAGRCTVATGRDLTTLALPDTVEGIIGSRIDRLAPQPELVLKVASAVGPTFGHDVIHDVYPLAEDRGLIGQSLDTLVRRDLTVLVPPPPGVSYSFRHALTREVAYNRMLFSQRRELHRGLANWFETRYAANLEPVLATLAHHWSRAGDVAKASEYLELASTQAMNNGMSREAATLGLRAVEMLDVPLPREPEAIGALIGETLEAITARMAALDVEDIAGLAPATDPRKAGAIGALLRVVPAVFVSQQVQLFVLIGLRAFLLTLEHGATPFTPGVIAIYAMIVRAMDANPRHAFALSSLAEELADRDSPPLRSYAGFVHHYFVRHWLEPAGGEIEEMRENARLGFEYGDVMFGCYNSAGYVVLMAASGAPLADVIAAGKASSEEIAGRVVSAGYHAVHEPQLAKALAGRTVDRLSFTDRPEEGTVEEARDLASITRTDLYDQIGAYMISKLRLHFLYREYRRAVSYGERAEQVLPSFAGQVFEADFTFYFALALFARYRETGEEDLLARAQVLAERVAGWEHHAPHVFAHKTLALAGAQARARGDDRSAAELFGRAAAAAEEIGFTHHVALGYELAGRSLLDAGEPEAARAMLGKSRDAYQQWGAAAKVADVEAASAESLGCSRGGELPG